MPFSSQVRPFNPQEISALNPGQIGVYGILRPNGSWVYVGRGDIRERLLSHVRGDNACIARSGATHWVAELTSTPVARERQLILELRPSCNLRVG